MGQQEAAAPPTAIVGPFPTKSKQEKGILDSSPQGTMKILS